MCRLAAFPPNFPRKEALAILKNFEGHNEDGTGYTYINDGKFVTVKWPKSLSYLLKRDEDLLRHMPHNGWTIAHLRAASHGANTYENTHPFEIGKDWAICHNGVWSDNEIVKIALAPYIKFKGETDSEVACHLINNMGPKKFAMDVDGGGVYLALNLDGTLWVTKTSGDLVLNTLEDKRILLASDLDIEKYTYGDAFDGWYHFDKNGKFLSSKAKPSIYTTYGGYPNGNTHVWSRAGGQYRYKSIHASATGVSAIDDWGGHYD